MAQAVQQIRPGAKLAFGPPVEHGFYYDDLAAPRFAIACPQTCALGGTVEIATGCTAAQ